MWKSITGSPGKKFKKKSRWQEDLPTALFDIHAVAGFTDGEILTRKGF